MIDIGAPPPVPRSADPAELGFEPQPRVRWFSPGTLIRTGVQALVAQRFAELLDRRELQTGGDEAALDLSVEADGQARAEIWIDYVADTGDGFDATAAVAGVLARDTLDLGGVATRAGSLLVLGGDAVYPAASERNYADRLIGPFRAMLPWTDRPRQLLALPGNHDWYDGLTSFLRTFCRPGGRWIGGWRTAQTRSYWAGRLPQGWWLWGIDIALGSTLDSPQLAYFEAMRERLADGDRIILCWAKPTWTDPGTRGATAAHATLDRFVDTVIRDPHRVRLCLAGDQHHYARYSPADPELPEKITAGGGGAYLTGTQTLRDRVDLPPVDGAGPASRRHRLAACYPGKPTSRRLGRRVPVAIYGNRWFWAIPAVLYALLTLPVHWLTQVHEPGRWTWQLVPPATLCGATAATLILGLYAFAGYSHRPGRARAATAAVLHAVLHGAAIGAAVVLARQADWPFTGDAFGSVVAGLAVGALAGPFLTGLYLMCAQFLRVNVNELFSAAALTGHRCFLRLHIGASGDLTVYPVGIETTSRQRFDPGSPPTGPWYTPDVPVRPALIEAPITVPKWPPGADG